MAKLKGPLFSLGASQQLGKALVYFSWKGLNVVREYVVPSNPKTAAQTTHRGHLTEAVAAIHAAQAAPVEPFDEADASAYALWGSTYPTPRTWFNQAVKNWIDQLVAGLKGVVWRQHDAIPAVDTLDVAIRWVGDTVTAGNFHYGTSKTNLLRTEAGAAAGDAFTAAIASLVTGTKYFIQFRPTAPPTSIGANSGIFYGVPT